MPVALVAGLSRAAKQGILIKGTKALETMARLAVVVLDKTGKLTERRARLVRIEATAEIAPAEVLRLAASLDQVSKHPIAQTIVGEARGSGLALSVPRAVAEAPGDGIEGGVDGRRVFVGGAGFVAARLGLERKALPPAEGEVSVGVGIAIEQDQEKDDRDVEVWHGSKGAAEDTGRAGCAPCIKHQKMAFARARVQ